MFDTATAPRFAAVKATARRTTWGGDCYAYGLLALGLVDAVVDATMKPWDWAALVPVIEGAGGSCTDWSGRPLRLYGDGTVLALGDPSMLPEVSGLLAG
jgi:myo-inositol-1(or 4)-monophosphatase